MLSETIGKDHPRTRTNPRITRDTNHPTLSTEFALAEVRAQHGQNSGWIYCRGEGAKGLFPLHTGSQLGNAKGNGCALGDSIIYAHISGHWVHIRRYLRSWPEYSIDWFVGV